MIEQVAPSGYRGMWLFAMFDLPVDTKQARKAYAQFRAVLLKYGFSMLQFSIYARYFGSDEASQSYHKKIVSSLPAQGQVRLLAVTDHQFGKMEVFYGKNRDKAEKPPEQLLLF